MLNIDGQSVIKRESDQELPHLTVLLLWEAKVICEGQVDHVHTRSHQLQCMGRHQRIVAAAVKENEKGKCWSTAAVHGQTPKNCFCCSEGRRTKQIGILEQRPFVHSDSSFAHQGTL
jgi:hypothetical protein